MTAPGPGGGAGRRPGAPGRRRLGRAGLVAGPLLALGTWLALPGLEAGGRATAALAVWMAVWWLSEAIPIYATALLPLAYLPLLTPTPMRAAAAPYAHELIFLFMGGFLIALTMERWGLHRRLALLALRLIGDRPSSMVGGFMLVTALLSMWVSNTATAVMMLPVAVSVIELVEQDVQATEGGARASRSFAVCSLLGIAYGASIGGLATPIGTPPNLFLLSYARTHLGHEISFVRWMGIGLPLVAVFLPLSWLLLTRVLYPVPRTRIAGGRALVRDALARLGPMGRGERIALAAFLMASLLWVTRPLLTGLEVAGRRPLAGLSDAGIAMLAALLLFVAPVDLRRGRFALDWDTAVKLPWGILLLFGGGLSLATALQEYGIGELLAGQVARFAAFPEPLILIAVVALFVFLTELTSNTATAAALIPVVAAMAVGLGVEPMLLAVPAALGASCAFMLPVATPPNAVIFGSGRIGIAEMSRAGIWLNLVGIGLIGLLAYAVVRPLLGLG